MTTWMAASRLYLGDHWLTDVVASIMLADQPKTAVMSAAMSPSFFLKQA